MVTLKLLGRLSLSDSNGPVTEQIAKPSPGTCRRRTTTASGISRRSRARTGGWIAT